MKEAYEVFRQKEYLGKKINFHHRSPTGLNNNIKCNSQYQYQDGHKLCSKTWNRLGEFFFKLGITWMH